MLYHYCTTPTAFSILDHKTIRLSPLSAANDSMEGRLFGTVFRRLLRSSKLSRSVSEVASIVVDGHADHTEGFAFCLSEAGDLLSQWRAYADDGYGIAIGFDKALLTSNDGISFGADFFQLQKVTYGEGQLEQLAAEKVHVLEEAFAAHGDFLALRPDLTREEALAILADRQATANGIFRAERDQHSLAENFLKEVSRITWEAYLTKPESFREEAEWRLLRFRHRAFNPELKFQADRKQIKPFIECVVPSSASNVIASVTLGPRNESNINWVRAYLDQIGLSHVTVSRSAAKSYR